MKLKRSHGACLSVTYVFLYVNLHSPILQPRCVEHRSPWNNLYRDFHHNFFFRYTNIEILNGLWCVGVRVRVEFACAQGSVYF